MQTEQIVELNCRISRGGFSEERVFEVSLAAGGTYLGTSPRHYCYTRKGQPLDPDQPPRNGAIEGKILARVVRREEGQFLVSLPDGSVVPVARDQVVAFRGSPPDVPVEP